MVVFVLKGYEDMVIEVFRKKITDSPRHQKSEHMCKHMQVTPRPGVNTSPRRAAHLCRELEICFISRGLHLSTKRGNLKGNKQQQTKA